MNDGKTCVYVVHNRFLNNILNLFGLSFEDFDQFDTDRATYKYLELLSPLSMTVDYVIDLEKLKNDFDPEHITFEMLLGFQYKKDIELFYSLDLDLDLTDDPGHVIKKKGIVLVSFEMDEKKVIIHELYTITDFLDEKIRDICPDEYYILIR